jgi:DNA-binding Lrp family transcriptional regulator
MFFITRPRNKKNRFFITLESFAWYSSHCRRQSLMRLMAEKSRTVKEMAQELDIPPSRLYYHVNQLERHGIIRVVSTQIVSGIVEKRYHISARAFRVDRALLAPGSEQEEAAIEAMMQSTFEATEDEIRRGLRTGAIDMTRAAPEPGAIFIGHSLTRLTPQQYRDFLQRLADLYAEFEAISGNTDDVDSKLTGLLVAIYPTAPPTTET